MNFWRVLDHFVELYFKGLIEINLLYKKEIANYNLYEINI